MGDTIRFVLRSAEWVEGDSVCVEDQTRDSGDSLGKAGYWAVRTRVTTGEMERNGQIMHI